MTYKNHEITFSNNGVETIDGLDFIGGNEVASHRNNILFKFNKNLAIYKSTIYASRTETKYIGINRHTSKVHNFGSDKPTKKFLETYTDYNGGFDYTLPFTVVDENEILKVVK